MNSIWRPKTFPYRHTVKKFVDFVRYRKSSLANVFYFKVETYLKTCFRTSTHDLEIERGRYIIAEVKACIYPYCKKTDDERHMEYVWVTMKNDFFPE